MVDFNMLQTVLHCLAQQLRILGKNVELRGSVAALPMARENAQTIAVSEYRIDTDQVCRKTNLGTFLGNTFVKHRTELELGSR